MLVLRSAGRIDRSVDAGLRFPTPMLGSALRLGETDCEALGEGILAQPVNAISSLAYSFVGLWLILRTRGRGAEERKAALVFGIALMLVGLGSFAFHGPQSFGSRWLHDWSIAVAIAFIVVFDLARWRSWAFGTLMPVYLGVATGMGVVFALAPDAGEWLLAAGVGALIVAEANTYRLGIRTTSVAEKRGTGIAAGAFGLALVLNLLGRTGAPWCDPASVLQGHAAWHLLTALAAAAFASAFLGRRITDESRFESAG